MSWQVQADSSSMLAQVGHPSNPKRPREDSVSKNDEHGSGSTIATLPEEKRQKQTAGATVTMHSTEALNTQILSAFDIRWAISEIYKVKSIGYSVTKMGKHKRPTPGQQQVLDKLQAVADDFSQPYKFGTFDTAFHLRVTRRGCKFDGDVAPKSRSITELLPAWFANAAVSGYGDMKALETKVDPTVRDAKEILATEFTVDPSLLEQIRATWARCFIPTNVRVEPYKIHLYGPQGHFESHRDTPEVDLVGTFLVGLGDTSGDWKEGNFRIGKEKLRADACSWVAFHPDVPHAVSHMYYGHRAVIAFKIFHSSSSTRDDEEEMKCYRALEERLAVILADTPQPFGILLEHMYHIGISQLNGFDAVLLSAARRMQQAQVHLLPIVIQSDSTVYYDNPEDEDEDEDEDQHQHQHQHQDMDRQNIYNSSVSPFTSAHVDYILTGKQEAKEKNMWLAGIEQVPFYSWDFETATMQWDKQTDEINWTGNEADGENQSCIYVSHALLIFPEKDINKADP